MQIYSRLPLFHSEGSSGRGCEGVQNTRVPIKEETSRGFISRSENLRDLTNSVSIRKVVLAISRVTGCPPNELLNKRRSQLVQPFRTLMYLVCREYSWQPYTEIGNALIRDHTTIVQGAKRGKLLIKKSRKMRRIYNEVIKELDVIDVC